MTPTELSDRLDDWAVLVLKSTAPLWHRPDSRDLVRQLRRSATSAAVNYGAARGARSHADFVSKLGIALEEVEESQRWLRLCQRGLRVTNADLVRALDEARQLTLILGASVATAKRNRRA